MKDDIFILEWRPGVSNHDCVLKTPRNTFNFYYWLKHPFFHNFQKSPSFHEIRYVINPVFITGELVIMRKSITIILLVSQLLIIVGGVLPAMINFFVCQKEQNFLNDKLSNLPARTNFLSALNDIARQHEKEKQSKPVPESLVTSTLVFACIDAGSTLIRVFSSVKIIFSHFKTLDTLDGYVGLVVPPPKF